VYESYEGLEDLRKEVDTLLAEREVEPETRGGGGGSAAGKRYPKR
jgi:molybdenum-dependent DNA-binding transcriptional regulator ModE